MPLELSSAELTARAVEVLCAAGQGKRINEPLLSWIQVVNGLGFQAACKACPKLASEFNDWNVVEAINTVSQDFSRWPTNLAKIEAVASILIGRVTKAEIRAIPVKQS